MNKWYSITDLPRKKGSLKRVFLNFTISGQHVGSHGMQGDAKLIRKMESKRTH